MSSLKILFCTNAFEHVSNGPAKFANLLLRESRTMTDFEVRVLTEDISNASADVYKLKLNIPQVIKPFGQFIRMWRYHRESMRIRREFDFDAVVYNNALVGLLSAFRYENTFGMINDYTLATSINEGNNGGSNSPLKIWVFKHVERLFCRRTNRPVIVNSYYMSKILSSVYEIPKEKFRVLHKGIEDDLIEADRFTLAGNKLPGTVLFVKTNFQLAGFWILAKALILMNTPVSLTVVGPPEQYHEEIKAFFKDTPVEVVVHGYLPQERVYDLLIKHKVFCLPAFKEAFGVSNLEALALGCIVVTTNIGGIAEAVGNDKFAYLVSPGNPDELAESLKKAIDDGLYISKIDDLNKHLEKFSSRHVCMNFLNIISDGMFGSELCN